MKKKLLMLSVFALATTAMASATLKEEVSYDFKGTPTDVNVINDGKEDTTKQDHPLTGLHTPKAVTSLNLDTDLVKADLSFLLSRDFTYTPSNVKKLDNTGFRRVNNLTDGQTVSDLYGDAELTYKLNDNLTAKGFLHYNQNKKIHDKDDVQGAVKIGLDYDYAGVSGRGLLIALDPMLNSDIWHGFSMTSKTNVGKFELTGDALGLFKFKDTMNGKIVDTKAEEYDIKGIYLPKFYSEINLGAKYVNGALTSDNKLHYYSFIDENGFIKSTGKDKTKKTSNFSLGEISKFMYNYEDKDRKYSKDLPALDLKYTSENTYKYNDKLAFTGNFTLEHKMNKLSIVTATNSAGEKKYGQFVDKDFDCILEFKPGFEYKDQMDALNLDVTGDSKMSYDYGQSAKTVNDSSKLIYIANSDRISYSNGPLFEAMPGVNVKAEYKVNDELTATGHLGLGSDFKYGKTNAYVGETELKYAGKTVEITQVVKPSLGLGVKYMNGSLTASLNGDISNVDTFITGKMFDDKDKLVEDYSFERKFELENKGTDVHAKLDYKLNDQISFGSEASVNMSLSNDRTDKYSKDNKLSAKGVEKTTFKITDNGLDGDKKAKTFFSIYGSYMPMSSLTVTTTGKVELETTRTRIDSFKQSDKFELDHYKIQNQINELIPSFELKADYTILEGLKLGAKTSIGATYGNDGYLYSYDSKGNETNVTGHDDDIKKAEKINFKELKYNLGLTLSYEW